MTGPENETGASDKAPQEPPRTAEQNQLLLTALEEAIDVVDCFYGAPPNNLEHERLSRWRALVRSVRQGNCGKDE